MRLHPEFQAAMAKRGITDFATVQVDAWPAGHFGAPRSRIGGWPAAVAFVRPQPGDSEWAHPVDGVIALVDLNTLEVLRVDDHGVVPIPPESGNFDAAAGAPLRDDITPARDHPARGPELHARRPRAALAALAAARRLHAPRGAGAAPASATTTAAGCGRSCYRASLSEMVVPYGDPSPTHYFKNAFDAGENGVGIAASPLTLRLRLPGRDPLPRRRRVATPRATPVKIPNAICMHEEDYGVLWRHIEWRDGPGEVRRSRRLVDLVLLGDRQLRLRLLLVPVPGRHDRSSRSSSPACSRPARSRPASGPAHGVLVAPGPERDGAPALLQHAPRPRRRRPEQRGRRGVDGVAAARPGEPVRQRVPAAAPPLRTESEAQRRDRHARRRAGGRS